MTATYHLLGRSGLRVSPVGLGTMTFGWGADRATAEAIFRRYLEAGGNFVDTADAYADGTSEEWLGDFIAASGTRDQVVLATKFSFNTQPGNPNAGGNGRKNLRRALEGSLRRLKTDFIDLYWLHAWDKVTPVEEVMETLTALVREGKILHLGLSDVPAWYAARAQTLAETRGLVPVSALQLEYSLISRNLEREHLPMMQELGLSLVPWSPLASGFLTGKYRRGKDGLEGAGRVQEVKASGNPVLEKFARDERNWTILDAVVAAAKAVDRTPAEVALAWVARRPTVASVLIGATSVEQLEKNLAAATIVLPEEITAKLDAASALAATELDHFFGDFIQSWVNGGTTVKRL
jgi:aryl-alcohol dehydrogenase-like predicted oxidoreductase